MGILPRSREGDVCPGHCTSRLRKTDHVHIKSEFQCARHLRPSRDRQRWATLVHSRSDDHRVRSRRLMLKATMLGLLLITTMQDSETAALKSGCDAGKLADCVSLASAYQRA